jgi:hypothetical protein
MTTFYEVYRTEAITMAKDICEIAKTDNLVEALERVEDSEAMQQEVQMLAPGHYEDIIQDTWTYLTTGSLETVSPFLCDY